MSALEDALAFQIRVAGLPAPEREVQLVPERRFRWDFVWREPKPLVVEVDGGTWVNGGHNRGKQIASDAEKSALAAILGYRFFRVTGDQVHSGAALDWLIRALAP